jgi:hypothetical protein
MCNKDKEPELMEVLRRFSNRMRSKFDEKKDSWKRLDKRFYIDNIKSCLNYLEFNYPNNDELTPKYDYAYKCADLANFVMMLAENCLEGRYDTNGRLAHPEKVDAYIKEIKVDAYIKEIIVGSAGKNHLNQFKVESVYIGDDGVAHIFIDEGKK